MGTYTYLETYDITESLLDNSWHSTYTAWEAESVDNHDAIAGTG